ncbi:hypothetical protein PanWU01x14_022510 [Parasponia andersonii]|uniref:SPOROCYTELESS-like EAR-containing protein n=1 Tax=Parasponia andersonii TaxID=3476 RepID=A0A2P5DX77_PARAD|nr:hypothetical protein PanWU01x14_022510 [Parasponia andersonii]
MCSKTYSTDCDGDVGGNSWKMRKRQKVPKRGPGVAELEKILREQEKKSTDSDHDQDHHYHHHHQVVVEGLFQPSIPVTNSIVTYLDPNSTNMSQVPLPHVTNITNYNNANSALRGRCINDVGVGIGGGSAVFLPEGSLIPLTWTSTPNPNVDEGKSDGGISLPTTIFSNEYSHSGQYWSPRQKRQSTSMVLEVKRPPPPLLADNFPAGSVCHYQVPPVPSHSHIPDQATSFNGGVGYNLNFTKPIRREAKWDVPLEFSHLNNCNTEYEAPNGNFFKFVPNNNTATVLPPYQTVPQQFSKFDYVLPFQGSIKEPDGSDQNKPFYSFLPTKEEMGTQERLLRSSNKTEGGDKSREDDIDLNLKLSTRN